MLVILKLTIPDGAKSRPQEHVEIEKYLMYTFLGKLI